MAIHYPEPDRLPSEYVTVRDAIADLPNLDNFAELHKNDCIPLTPEQLDQLAHTATPYVQKLRDLTPDLNNFAYSRLWQPQLLTSSTRTRHTEASIERFEKTPVGKIEAISRLRRLDWDTPCHTLRAGTGSERGAYTSPRPIHPHYPRVISVREAARLHSFPDWFRFHATKWHGFRQVGNAVPPLLGRALGQQVIAALDVCPPIPTELIVPGCTQLLQLTLVRASRYWQAQGGSRSD
jgi:DNA (cytosine-5)-methyltransferase 1